jgi:predicted phage tail protein
MRTFSKKNSSKMYVSFDLGLSSDEEIITALQTMLPDLRKNMKLSQSKQKKLDLQK